MIKKKYIVTCCVISVLMFVLRIKYPTTKSENRSVLELMYDNTNEIDGEELSEIIDIATDGVISEDTKEEFNASFTGAAFIFDDALTKAGAIIIPYENLKIIYRDINEIIDGVYELPFQRGYKLSKKISAYEKKKKMEALDME